MKSITICIYLHSYISPPTPHALIIWEIPFYGCKWAFETREACLRQINRNISSLVKSLLCTFWKWKPDHLLHLAESTVSLLLEDPEMCMYGNSLGFDLLKQMSHPMNIHAETWRQKHLINWLSWTGGGLFYGSLFPTGNKKNK